MLFLCNYSDGESADYIHIAMEYVPHTNLRNYLKMERAESEAKAVIRQLLEGLVVIHETGFAHRNLKPEVRSLHPAPNTQLIGFIEHLWSQNLPYGSRSETSG